MKKLMCAALLLMAGCQSNGVYKATSDPKKFVIQHVIVEDRKSVV